MNKILNRIFITIFSIVVVAGLLIIDVVPISAAELPTIETAQIQRGDDTLTVKKGDKVVFAKDVVATVDSIDKAGNVTFTATIGELKYCEDLVTPISTQWLYNADKNVYYIKDNLYSVEVSGTSVTVTYNNESYSWNPELNIGKSIQKHTSYASLLNADTKSYADPINENYIGNTLYWQYGDNITRCLRAIEGMLIEYYTIDKMPDSDIRIVTNATKSKGYTYNRPEYAYDATGKSIALTSDSKSNGELLITLDSLKDAVFPITIDPDSSFDSTSADGSVAYAAAYDSLGGTTWANVYGSDGNYASSVNLLAAVYADSEISNYYQSLGRAALFFNTSSLGTSSVISAASVKLYGQNKMYRGDWVNTTSINLYSFTPDTANTLTEDDYNYAQWGTTAYSSAITYNSFNTSGYNTFNLNATGLAAINKTGYTNIGIRTNWDATNTAPTWGRTETGNWYISMSSYTYEKGAGYRPTLTVTYTSAPTVTNSTGASEITDTTAQLNGVLTNTGGLSTTVKVYYGDNDGGTTAGSWDSNYDFGVKTTTGALYHVISGLTADTTYYYRFFSTNSLGDSWASSTSSFSTYPEPAITIGAASVIAKSTARLNATITQDGNSDCQVRWGYGTTTQSAIEDYDTYTEYAGTYRINDKPYLDLSSLTGDTTYYYRVEITNGVTTNLSGELSFETLNAIADIQGISAYSKATSIILNWNMGDGASQTMIRVSTDTYPTSISDGTLVYLGNESSYQYTGLTVGTTYYFSAWGESGGSYSSNAVTTIATTDAYELSDEVIVVDLSDIDSWTQKPDGSGLTKLEPFYTMVTGLSDSIGMPVNNVWLMIGTLFSFIVALGVWVVTKTPLTALVTAIACMLMCVVVGIMPSWIIILIAIIAVGALLLPRFGMAQG